MDMHCCHGGELMPSAVVRVVDRMVMMAGLQKGLHAQQLALLKQRRITIRGHKVPLLPLLLVPSTSTMPAWALPSLTL